MESIVLFKNKARYTEKEFREETDFEELILNSYKTLFGEKTILLPIKKKLETKAFRGTIPDAFLLNLTDIENPEFHIVEIELARHDFFRHIFPQITKFFAWFRNVNQQNELLDKLHEVITSDKSIVEDLKRYIGKQEVFKFLRDTVEDNPHILLILDREMDELPEITDTYTDTWGKMVRVEIVKQYTSNGDSILSICPDFELLDIDEGEIGEKPPTTSFTEEYHLENASSEIKTLYQNLKTGLLQRIPGLQFNPRKFYISTRIHKNFAFFGFRKKKITLVILEDERVARKELPHYQVKSLVPGMQAFYGVPSCEVILENAEHLEEVLNLLDRIKK